MFSFALAYVSACTIVALAGGTLTWHLLSKAPGTWGPGWAWALPVGLVMGSIGLVLGQERPSQASRRQMWDAAAYLLLPVGVVIAALGPRVGRVEWALAVVTWAGVGLRAIQSPIPRAAASWREWLGALAGMCGVVIPVVVIASGAGEWTEAGLVALKGAVLAWSGVVAAAVALKHWDRAPAKAAAIAAVTCGAVVASVASGWKAAIAMGGVTLAWAGMELGWRAWGWVGAAVALWAWTQGPAGQALAGGLILMGWARARGTWRWVLLLLGAGILAWVAGRGLHWVEIGPGRVLVAAALIAGVGTRQWSWLALGLGAGMGVAAGGEWCLGAMVGPVVAWTAAGAMGMGRQWLRLLWWAVAGAGWLATAAASVGLRLGPGGWWALGALGIGVVWAWAMGSSPPEPHLRPARVEIAAVCLGGLVLLGLTALS